MTKALSAKSAQPGRRDRGCTAPPAERRRFFSTDESIRVLGAKVVAAERNRLARELKRVAANVPSAAWLEAVDEHGQAFPPGGGQTAMVMSVVSGRFTPPHALAVEDLLDSMTAREADWYSFPASPSAVAIEAIAAIRAEPVDGW